MFGRFFSQIASHTGVTLLVSGSGAIAYKGVEWGVKVAHNQASKAGKFLATPMSNVNINKENEHLGGPKLS
jgi:hypothetical protein